MQKVLISCHTQEADWIAFLMSTTARHQGMLMALILPDVNDKVIDEEWDPENVGKLVVGIFWPQKVDIVWQQHRLCSNHKPAQ